MSDEELSKVSYEGIDMLKAIPSQPTHKNYVIVGGSGWLGRFIIKLLLLRGETKIRVLDIHPPHSDVASEPGVHYIHTDISSLQSVREGLSAPFPGPSDLPIVIFHTAALIRFWERASYTWKASHKVNVLGTSNVLSVAKKLPNATVIYTSSADAAIPAPKFSRLGFDQKSPPRDTVTISDNDVPLAPDAASESAYTRSKVAAERLVIGANGWNGLKTGIIRPGHTIIGPNDRLLTSTLSMPRVPVFDSVWSHTNVCVWDAAAAHLMYENAMQQIPDEVSGQMFLVTGNGPAWRIRDTRNALKELSLAPSWIGQLLLLQPATFEYWLDVVIDDSRARKLLGYRPQWDTVQVIKYTVDELESGRAQEGHGLELKERYTTETNRLHSA
ncbi:hypothetical protein HWV62_45649 [Athelia sp. TMB]|nr:hypothetical protein HWV62_45649 [Athelia sp. TMB]